MKFKNNGKLNNIILDDDIVITGDNNLGGSISNILNSHDKDIKNLKSNVKWLYKYGGVGSGGGSGQGPEQVSWGILVTVNKTTAVSNNSTVYLDKNSKTTEISISISKGISNYTLEGTCYQFEGEETVNDLNLQPLNSDNSWKTKISLNLKKDGTSGGSFIVVVTDQLTNERKTISFNFISNPYNFVLTKKVKYNNSDDPELIGSTLLINDRIKKVYLDLSYSTALPLEKIIYNWTIDNTNYGGGEVVDQTEIVSNIITLDISNISNLNNTGLHKIVCNIQLIKPNVLDPIEITLQESITFLPEDLYLVINFTEPLYNELPSTPEKPTEFGNLNKALKIKAIPYLGNRSGEEVEIYARLYNYIENRWVKYGEDTGKTKVKLKQESLDLPGIIFRDRNSSPGWKKIEIIGSIGVQYYKKDYYIYLDSPLSRFNWFHANEKIVSKEINSTYFRKGTLGMIENGADSGLDSNSDFYKFFSILDNSSNSKVITKESNTSTINLKNNFKEGNNDLCISIGICYSENNTIENPILIAETVGSLSGTIYVIELYQNKIILKKNIGTSSSKEAELSIYLEKTSIDNYSGATTEDYHLVQIMLADDYEKKESGSNTSTFYKKLYVYIDGVIEGSATKWFEFDIRNLEKIRTCSGNYKINLLEITQFPKVSDSTEDFTYYIDNTDLFAYYYYLSYNFYNSDIIDENLSELINNIYETGSFIIENELLKLSSDSIMKYLIKSAGIPSLYCEISNNISFNNKEYTSITWLNSKYGENTSDTGSATKLEEVRVPINKLYWCDSKNNTELAEITTGSLWNTDKPHFYLRLQGSSTMRYKSKNFTLGVESGDGNAYLFSPNFNKTDKTSFLPEQSFTLKADVVDSSHTNNCCLGKFINNVTEAESEAKITKNLSDEQSAQQSTNGIYSDHIKPCLTGFPILMFLGIKSTDGEVTSTSYYYLGIYNFNLGRESHFNLGYIKNIDTVLGTIEKEGFIGVVTDEDDLNLKEKLIVAEIQGNGEVFDFHQYDETILFPLDDKDKNCMFGDFVRGSNQVSNYTSAIIDFVQSVSKAGGFLFNKIGKEFININDSSGNLVYNNSYHIENTVPDYRNQVTRKIENNRNVYTSKNISSDSSITDLKKCINGYTDTINGNGNVFIPAKLNYKSLVDYYTICMAFGLVDSVQKNLNIKTWKDTFGIYFYDMDTSFGINNAGLPTSIFCFSDYWRSNNSTIQEPDPFDYSNPNPSNKQIEVPTSLTLYRDYFPTDESEEGYDIPSSYLFAIAKYAKLAESSEEGGISVDNYFPQQLWANWRSSDDILKTPQKFFNTYYKGHLGNIPGILKSLNYRSKYLFRGYHTAESTKDFNDKGDLIEFNSMAFTTDLSSFGGSRLSYVKNWLINRVHILDLYFNILNNTITFDNVTSEVISEPQHNINISNLNDVIIQKDIFSNIANPTAERKYKAGNITFYVEVPNEFCPLAIKVGNLISYYILRKTNTIYKISQSISGNVNVRFGGSTQFSKIDSISGFLAKLSDTTFYLKSDKLNHIVSNNVNSTEGTEITSMVLDIPAAEEIVLTNSTYEFTLTIDDKYQYLSELDISNSKISIKTTGNNAVAPSLRNIDLSNINSITIDLLKIAEDQTNVTLTNSSIAELSTYCWKTESISQTNLFSLSNKESNLINVTTLNLTTNKYRDLEINSINDLKTATLTGFKSIKILDCSNLNTLSIAPPEENNWSLELNNCNSIINISLDCDNLTKLSLRNCYNLNSLTLTGNTEKLTYLDLSNTKIKTIVLNSKNTSYNGHSLLDLTEFSNLSEFYIEENKEITYVKFKNDSVNYFELKDKAFYNCSNLIRVFGNILLTGSYVFSGCSKFSVHGYFENSDDGTLRLVDGSNKINFNNKPVCDDIGQVIHPLETLGDDYKNKGYRWLVENTNWSDSNITRHNMITQEGDFVTNIRINNLYGDSSYTGTFSNTSVTIFDIYYILQNIIPKDNYGVNTNIVSYESSKNTDELIETGERTVNLGDYFSGTNNGWGANTFYIKTSLKSGDCRLFNWTSVYDNSPNKYILHDWGWTLGSARRFMQNRLGTVKFFIPTDTPGIMDQLKNCNDFNAAFYSDNGCIYTDKTILHCKDDNDVKLLSNPGKLSDIFYNICFIDPLNDNKNVNNWEYSDIFDGSGNLNSTVTETEIEESSGDKLFKYLGNITGILDSFEFKSSYRLTRFLIITKFINFTKCKLLTENSKNRDKGTYFTGILASIRATYGCGTFKLDNLLDEDYLEELIVINNSIKVGGYYNDIIPKMELNNNTFEYLSENFLQFGYYIDGNSTGDNGNITHCSFNGFKKLIGNNFKNIISKFKNLTHCTGLFANGEYNSEIKLPGEIFENNTKLRKLNYCFYNLKANITLTSNGFSNCTELNNVRYLFATKRDINYLKKDGDIKLGIHSKIPYKFLYHGNQINDRDSNFYITYKGLDNPLILSNVWEAGDNYYEYQPDNSIKYRISKEDVQDNSILPTNELTVIEILQNGREKQENVYPGNLDSSILETLFDNFNEIQETTISFTKPRSNIINMERCFHNQMFLLNYSQDSNVSKENNEEYIPYKFYKKDGIWVERDNNPIYTNAKIDIWYNDGSKLLEEEGRNILDPSYTITTNGSNYTLSGDTIIYPNDRDTGSIDCINNYSCPPDLFRYCNNTSSLNITGVFENCGYDRTNRTNSGGNFNDTSYGIPGRICPYLLKPISNVTNISKLFLNNKRLSHYCYSTNNSTASVKKIRYMIPEDFFKYATNITTLDSTFYGMIWKEGIKLDNIFTYLTNSLTLNKTFYAPYFPTENTNSFVEIKNIFINNTITSAKEVFHSGFTGDITKVIINDQLFDINPRVKFIRNFNKSKLNNLFSEYSDNYHNYVTNHDDLTITDMIGGCFSENDSSEFNNSNDKLDTIINGTETDNYYFRDRS